MDTEDVQLTSAELIYATFTETPLEGENPKSLKKAKQSPKWPEWKCTVKTELAQLQAIGTWELADKPADTILISNKWVFDKRSSKLNDILKYKRRLVAKGCAQRPGHDYLETFSPVVQLETI